MVERDSEKIYSLGYSFILVTGLLSIFIAKGNYILFSNTKNDTIFAAIIGFLLSFLLFFIVRFIVNKNENDDVYELNRNIFGKILGSILNIIMWIGFFIVASIILYNMADFFNTVYLSETSVEYLKILVILPIIYASTKNIATLIKMNQVLAIASITLVFISFLGIFQKIQITNLEPIFISSKENILKSIITYFVLSSVPLCMLLTISKKNIKDKERLNGNLLKTYIFGNVILIAILLVTVLVLGIEYIDIFRFPEYITIKQFSLFNILERVENVLALQYYFNCAGLLGFLYYFLIRLLPKNKFSRYYSIIIAILQIIFTSILFKNTITFIEMIKKYFAYSIVICIILPIIITFFKLKSELRKEKIAK